MREKAEPQIYTFIALKTRIEITPSTPAKGCKHLTNHRESPNLKSDSHYLVLNRRGSPGPAKRLSKFNWAATLTLIRLDFLLWRYYMLCLSLC